MVDVRVDGPAIDRAAALLALHDPGAGESQIQNSHSRIIGEEKEKVISLPFPSGRTAIHPLFNYPGLHATGFVPLIN
jgi:hypothetical protein